MKNIKLIFVKQENSLQEIPLSDRERVERLNDATILEAEALIIKDTFEAEKATVAETIKSIKEQSKEAFETACTIMISDKERIAALNDHVAHEEDIASRKACLEVKKTEAEEEYKPMMEEAAAKVAEAKRGTEPREVLCRFERIEGSDDILITDADTGAPIISRPICNDDQILPLGLNEGETGQKPAEKPKPEEPEQSSSTLSTDDIDSELIEQAKQVIRDTKRASTSGFQRRLHIGYNRAAMLMEQLENLKIIGPPQGAAAREILIDTDGGES